MSFEVEIPLAGVRCAAGLIGLASFLFGVFTAVWPRRSIALYEWLMARINWRVAPIDEAREIRTTRILGILLTLLSAALEILSFRSQI